ncbi:MULTISPECIES: DUF2929 family protein [Ureibacillus]|jgi:uncharacterized PurR-regulated membrane protein YhhQ (DUF165 family)|uniref:Uncharacterized PurR-regulated membrane protein YhhQ (DUF165 family) n=1 Tax=Ureibacillus thermosphaericus TaxID=51173 RepID=A0A840PVE4_URETH|nr:DUF2929 family protein [Ureibacillus thermosphaericus]MBB5149224.1 uncharacterized PurR-regulated membrane protein YhhQ (DUF165 family) [Ureibacillus thermosphaericus]NKZ32041.1 DUF2929 family protein [Ureibacillus thermosphaericus]
MQYIMSFIWGILLISMLSYVVGSILGITVFDFVTTLVVAVIFTVLVWVVAAIIPSESPKELKADQQ